MGIEEKIRKLEKEKDFIRFLWIFKIELPQAKAKRIDTEITRLRNLGA